LRWLQRMGVWRGLVTWALAFGFVAGRVEAQRLPGGVRPEHYSLVITPDLKAATFAGAETIDVVLERPATAITLNAAEIEFVSAKAYVWPSGLIVDPAFDKHWREHPPMQFDLTKLDKEPQAGTVTLDAAKEQATLTFAKPLPAGPVTLAIAYTGNLNNKLRGFYLSRTKLRSYGVTQFEATDARRAFPSFDEPALKATFDVTLLVSDGDAAISNMDVISDTTGPISGKHTVKFRTTPKMSTYLVAWLVGDFQCSSGKSDGVAIRACATPDKAGITPFAVDAAKFYLHFYDNYFGIKYPLPKLDLVAIPDFEAGAMENFGCITFRETELLVDAKDGTLVAKKEVAQTVAHEMSHMWFGDLVTPAWWNDLWLNEGFATWMETKAAAKWHPDWGYAQSVADDLNSTMDEDAGRATRAVRTRAETPAEINELFDDIAYGKAGAVIRMVENYEGEDVFRKGVQTYLKAHLYRNAAAEDFWSTAAQVSGKPVDKVMQSFIEQPGVPLISLADKQTSGVAISQAAFALSSVEANLALSSRAHPWTIPVCVKTNGKPECHVIEGADATSPGLPQRAVLPIRRNASEPFLFANAGDKGYYRTDYAASELAGIVANAETGLTPPERVGLIGDRWALMRAGRGSVGEFLDLALALKQDQNGAVVEDALDRVADVKERIASDDDRARLNTAIRSEFGPVYAAMGKPEKRESNDRLQIRGTLFQTLGDANDPGVLAEAEELTNQLFAGQKTGRLAILDAAITLTVAHGDAAMYEKLLRVAENATDPDLKTDALHTLARFTDPKLVQRTLDYGASGKVRNQDSWALFALLLQRRETREQAWEYVQEHWETIVAQGTVNSGERIVEATGAFCSVKQRDEVQSFFAAHPVESAERTLKKAVDSINDCIQVRATEEPKLKVWLDGRPK
jgi:aminopeptidase N